jgi:predicted transcriptional regulator
MELQMLTGEYLKKLRVERGLSQTEVAKFADVSQAHVAKIEGGKVDPRLSTVNKILLVLSERERKTKTCADIMSRVIFVRPDTPVKKVIAIMRTSGFSQLPVIDRGRQIGGISEETLLHNMDRRLERLQAKDIIEETFPLVDAGDRVDIILPLLEMHAAVLVACKGKICGIITKSDMLGLKEKK